MNPVRSSNKKPDLLGDGRRSRLAANAFGFISNHDKTSNGVKRLLLRVDFNVPTLNGKITDDFRIVSHLPTIKYYLKKNYKIILISHLEQSGKIPHFGFLQKFLEKKLKKKNITLLENLRLNPGEKKNDLGFAKKLA